MSFFLRFFGNNHARDWGLLECVTLGFGYAAYMRPDGHWYDYNERDEYMSISQRG